MNSSDIVCELKAAGNPEKARHLSHFFKTGKGEYGEGDLFLGVTVPEQRNIARKYHQAPPEVLEELITSPWHECRLTALLILVYQFEHRKTKEEQEKVNTRQAERKLRILINANYGYGDYHLVLDYIRRKGEPDRTPEQMRQDIDVFLRECRKEYRKAGLEFKYIHVMEIGKKGARHHHLVVNKIDTEILQRCWYKAYEGHNRVKVFPLDDSGNYAELASYLIKYTGTHKKGTDGALQGKRWNCSKNLVRPEPEYHIISDREYFKKEPKAIKGYYVDKI